MSGLPAAEATRVAVVTISDTRTAKTDEGGRVLASALEAAGASIVATRIVRDEVASIQEVVREFVRGGAVDAVVTTGGTGIGPRDVTIEAIAPLLGRTLDGFGEAFRRLSWESVGARSILSRALAGTIEGCLVVALPGSPKALRLAVEEILGPVLAHAVAMARGRKHLH